MNAHDAPQIARLASGANWLRGWDVEAVLTVLSSTELVPYDFEVVKLAAMGCWSEADTEKPVRLLSPGPWWRRAHAQPPGTKRLADLLPPRGVSSPGAREQARARLDAALHQKPAEKENDFASENSFCGRNARNGVRCRE